MEKLPENARKSPRFDAEMTVVNGVQIWIIGGTEAAHDEVREAVGFALDVLTSEPEASESGAASPETDPRSGGR